MEGLKAKLAAFKRSRAGQFLTKFSDDQATSLAQLLAWGTLSTLVPLILGVLGVAGLVLRDPARLNQVYGMLVSVVPAQAAGPLGDALEGVRKDAAGPASIVGLLLLLFNGSGFFANMATVFDRVYHVPDRNFIMQRLVAAVMLVVITALLIVSTLALGFGSIIGSLPLGSLPVGPVVGRVLSWSLSIVSAFALFVLLYKVLPNVKHSWRNVLPGAGAAMVLFFIISMLFPLYLTFFPPNQAYAVFGVFLVFTFWLYLLGIVFVFGAELNAFLLEPARSVALAEATEQAQHGKADVQADANGVRAEATGTAPGMAGSTGGARQQVAEHQPSGSQAQPAKGPAAQPGAATSIAGKVLGFVGLVLAAFLVRGSENGSQPSDRAKAQPARS